MKRNRHALEAKVFVVLEHIEPRYTAKFKWAGLRRSFRSNYRSKFLSAVFLKNSAKRVFGFLRVRIFDESQFEISVKGGSTSVTSVHFYIHANFPFISLKNKNGKAHLLFSLFSTKIKIDEQLSFSLVQRKGHKTKTFHLGDLSGVSEGASKQIDYSQIKDLEELQSRVVAAASRKPLSVQEYCSFMSEYSKLRFPPEAGPFTHQFLAVLNASTLRNHSIARRNYTKCVKAFRAMSDYTGAESVDAVLKTVTKPYILGPHGYRLPLTEIDLATALNEVNHVIQKIESFGAVACIASGTLLGLVRDGRLLPHDDDMDLNVVINGSSLQEVLRTWKSLMVRILDEMPAFRKDGFVAIELPCGIEVDFFPAWIIDGKAFAYPYMFGTRNAKEYVPFVSREWSGVSVPVPADVETILEANYGAWRTPDPHWRFDWASARDQFRDFVSGVKQ